MAASAKYQGWIVSGIYNGLQKLSIPIFGVLSTMLLTKRAFPDVSDMGVWSLFLTVTSFVELFRQALVKTSLIKYLNHSKEEEQKYVLTAAFCLNAIITLILCLVFVFCSGWIAHVLKSPKLEPMLQIFIVGMLLLIPFSHFEWIMYGKTKFKGLFWTYFVRQGLSLLIIAIVYFSTHNITLNRLVVYYCIGIIGGSIIGYLNVRSILENTFAFSKHWITQLLHFGKYVFGSGVSTLIFRNADQMILSSLSGTFFTALQGVSMRVINLADIPSQVLADLLFPRSSSKEMHDNPGRVKYYYEKTVGATLCFIMPAVLFMMIFPKFIIWILADEKYYAAIPYLQLISFTGIFLAFLKQYGVIIDSTGRPYVNFVTITIIAVLEIIFCYFFIRAYGLLGAAYGLLCTHVIGFIMTQSILKRYFQINFLNCFKHAFQLYPELFRIFTERIKLKLKTQ